MWENRRLAPPQYQVRMYKTKGQSSAEKSEKATASSHLYVATALTNAFVPASSAECIASSS